MFYPLQPAAYATGPVPTVDEWKQLWAAWDTVTRMVPEQDLLSKPIKLRNAVIFYLGHIPTFLDMHLTRATGGKPSEPSHYPTIFERGIDPDVDNPEQCHAHSETPESWPAVSEILQFQDRVRQRVQDIMASPKLSKEPKVQRALWLGYEHEIMHLETLLYMLVQSERLLPPGGVVAPDFAALAQQSEQAAVPNDWFEIPKSEIVLGLDDPETEDGGVRFFGWDNEKPPRKAHVPAFSAKARPITNGEYAEYLAETGTTKVPASWIEHSTTKGAHVTNGANSTNNINGRTNVHTTSEAALSIVNGKYVRTVFGPVPLKYALDWPIFASYDELLGCANWMGGRIPTLEEARSLYGYVERLKAKDDQSKLSKTIPAVNGHLVNDGVEESPPSNGLSNGSCNPTGPDPNELFVNLEGANVGFKFWHPVSVTQRGDKLCGQGDMGGVWEWTSSALEKHDGFEAMSLYPGYTADFFDGKHNIVLGGSWATHPRIAGRKTFVNWYQRNYPYVWAGARLVRDL